MLLLKYCLILLGMHLTGSAILFGIISGPTAIVATPLLGLFGWFFIIPEAVAVTILARLYKPIKNQPILSTLKVWLPYSLVGAILVAVLCPKEQSNQAVFWLAGFCAGFGATSFAFYCIHKLKLKTPNDRFRGTEYTAVVFVIL